MQKIKKKNITKFEEKTLSNSIKMRNVINIKKLAAHQLRCPYPASNSHLYVFVCVHWCASHIQTQPIRLLFCSFVHLFIPNGFLSLSTVFQFVN